MDCRGRPRRRSGIRPKTNMEVKRHEELPGPTSRCHAASSRLLRVGLQGRRAAGMHVPQDNDGAGGAPGTALRENSTSLDGEAGAEGWMNGCQEAPPGLWMTTSPFQDSPPRPPPARRQPFALRSPTCPDVRPGPGFPPATLPAAMPPAQARCPAARLPGFRAAGLPGPEPPSRGGGRMAALAGSGRGPEPSPPARARPPCAAPPAPPAPAAAGSGRRAPG